MGPSVRARLLRLIVLSSAAAVFVAPMPAPGQAPREATRTESPATIESTTAVLVVDPPAGAPDADALLQRRINTHVASLLSGHNLRRAVARPNVRNTRWFKESDDPADRLAFLRERLRVAAVPGTALIAVSLDAVRDPAERATIVEEVCNAYFDFRRTDRGNQILDHTAMLNNVKIKAEMRLKDLTAEMREKQIKLNLDGGAIGGRAGVKEMELSKLVGEQIQAQLRAGRAKAKLDALRDAVEQGKEPPAIAALADQDPEFRALRSRADEADARTEALAASPADTKDAAALPQLKATAEQLRRRAETRRTEALARAKVAAIEDAQAEFDRFNAFLEALSRRVDNLKQDLGGLSNAMVAYRNLQDEHTALRAQIHDVRRKIEAMMAEQSSREATDIHWHLTPDPR